MEKRVSSWSFWSVLLKGDQRIGGAACNGVEETEHELFIQLGEMIVNAWVVTRGYAQAGETINELSTDKISN